MGSQLLANILLYIGYMLSDKDAFFLPTDKDGILFLDSNSISPNDFFSMVKDLDFPAEIRIVGIDCKGRAIRDCIFFQVKDEGMKDEV